MGSVQAKAWLANRVILVCWKWELKQRSIGGMTPTAQQEVMPV